MNRRLLSCLMLILFTLQSVAVNARIPASIDLQQQDGAQVMSLDSISDQHCDHCNNHCCNHSCPPTDGCVGYGAVLMMPTSPLTFIAIDTRDESSVFVPRPALDMAYSPLKPPDIEQ